MSDNQLFFYVYDAYSAEVLIDVVNNKNSFLTTSLQCSSTMLIHKVYSNWFFPDLPLL